MIINDTGITKSDLTEYLTYWVNNLRSVLGNDYTIKKEGIVDNLATTSSLSNLAIEDVIMYLVKQMNPYTAEGEFQDFLYALVNLFRDYSTYTVISRTIQGTANTTYSAKSIRIKTKSTEDILELNTAVTTDGNGIAVGSFTAIELGSLDIDSSTEFNILDAPEGVEAVYYTSGNETSIGKDYEDDSKFRLKWLDTNSVQRTNKSGDGLKTALLPLCDNNAKNIKIKQNRTSSTDANGLFPHSLHIVLKSAESDTTIANTIFNNVSDCVDFNGTTEVVVEDSENHSVLIKFTRASEIKIAFNIEYVLKNGYTSSDVESNIKKAVVDNFSYELGERVVANDFYQYINALDGVDYVTTLEVKEKDDVGNYAQTVVISYTQYSSVDITDITVAEAE